MGNFLGTSNVESQEEVESIASTSGSSAQDYNQHIDTNYDFDKLSDDELIKLIRSINVVKLDYSKIKDLTKTIELVNIRLIPMCVELYLKLSRTLPKYVAPEKKAAGYKKKFAYVKPEFTSNDVIEKNRKQKAYENTDENLGLLRNLYVVLEGPIKYNTTPIKNIEYDEAFRSFEGSTDMMGMCRHILGCLLDHHKTRLINAFNNIYTGKDTSVFIGRATHIYKGDPLDKKDIMSYREIVVIPVIINHFHRILSLRLSNHLIQNKYLNTTIQKGGVLGQNNSLLQQIMKVKSAIKYAKLNNKPLCIMYLDIKNAFGSVCRKAMRVIMEKYYVDPVMIKYLENYYDNLKYYVQNKDVTTESCVMWKEGVVQGDPLSGTIFNMMFTYILHYIDTLYKDMYGFEMENIKLLLLAFVDDVALVTNSVEHALTLFEQLERMCKLIGLIFSRPKCSMMLINIPYDTNTNKVGEFNVRTTVKYLGAYINSAGDHIDSFKSFCGQLLNRMNTLNNSKVLTTFEDKMKAFTMTVLPYININLKFMYDIPVERKRKVINSLNHFLKLWANGKTLKIVNFDEEMVKIVDDEIVAKVIQMNGDKQYYDAFIQFEYTDCAIDTNKELSYTELANLEKRIDQVIV